jgi:uncharacterized Tic20 family protein
MLGTGSLSVTNSEAKNGPIINWFVLKTYYKFIQIHARYLLDNYIALKVIIFVSKIYSWEKLAKKS